MVFDWRKNMIELGLNNVQFEKLKQYISENIQKRKTINMNHTSYWYKHLFERKLGYYISNDDCKKALCECGFRYAAPAGSQNWYFNISEKCLKNQKI